MPKNLPVDDSRWVTQDKKITELRNDLRLSIIHALNHINHALCSLNTLASPDVFDVVYDEDRIDTLDMRHFLTESGRLLRAAYARNPIQPGRG